jgi:hypothetical protein
MFDGLAPVDAVIEAWTQPGANPDYHRVVRNQIRNTAPLLYRALERLAMEEYERRANEA